MKMHSSSQDSGSLPGARQQYVALVSHPRNSQHIPLYSLVIPFRCSIGRIVRSPRQNGSEMASVVESRRFQPEGDSHL